jgi:hypothetical protein
MNTILYNCGFYIGLLISAVDRGKCSASRRSRFILRKSPRYPSDKELEGFQFGYGSCELEKNIFPLLDIEPHSSSPWTVTTSTEIIMFKYCFLRQCENKIERARNIIVFTNNQQNLRS